MPSKKSNPGYSNVKPDEPEAVISTLMKEDQDHRDETKAISPLLADRPKTMPFRVPDTYFETLPEKMLDRVRTQEAVREPREETAREEIERISPLLASAFGLNPFKAASQNVAAVPPPPANEPAKEGKPVVRLQGDRKTRWVSYAAAAAAMGIIAFSALRTAEDSPVSLTSNTAKAETASPDKVKTSPLEEDAFSAYLNEQIEPLLLTAEATDTMMMKDALLILDPGIEAEENLFDDIPSKELYAFIEQVPDLSDLRPDME